MTDEQHIQQLQARYVRAADFRDGAAMADLFLPGGKVEIYQHNGGVPVLIGEINGADQIGAAVGAMMTPHGPREWSHHTTHDPIVEILGDDASLDVQFIVFSVAGAEKPEGGWPPGTRGAQGRITPIEAGYYRPMFRRVGGSWKIAAQRIYHDLPFAP